MTRIGDLRNWRVPIPLMAALLLAVFLTAGCQDRATTAPPAPVVEVMEPTVRDAPLEMEWVATLDGLVNASIRAQVQGYLIKQNYREGTLVRQGQTLFEIDPRVLQAAVEQAQANLAQNQAAWETAKANLTRIKPLAAQNAVSQKDLDEAMGNEQARRAAIQAARAALDKAKLDLGFTKVTSPILGIAGVAKAQLGNLVGPGLNDELTTVSTLNPIKANIAISEQEYLQAFQRDRSRDEIDMPLTLILADGSTHAEKGRFSFADRQVDAKTGTIRVTCLFPNPGNFLRPGQFARVRALVETRKNALLVPQRAVSELQGRYLLALVGKDDKVEFRPVKVGPRLGSQWLIEEGLAPGERVVVEGLMKARPGQAVTPKPHGGDSPPAGRP